uniref:Eukaryotic translation initiation factor-like protein n=1 Tax=Anisakis simplex TaxID=6269 RepID=A0A0M3JDX1_ANISI
LSASVLINLTYGMRARGELSNNSHRLVDSFDSALKTSGGNGRKTTGNNNNNYNNNNRMQYKPNWKGNNGNGKTAGRMRPGAELPVDFSVSAGSSQVDPWTPRALKAQASSKISPSEGVTIMTRKHEDESTSTRNSHRKPHERMQKEEVSYENREKIIESSGYGRPPTYLIEKNVRTSVAASEDAINAEAAKIIAQIEQKLTQKKVKVCVCVCAF